MKHHYVPQFLLSRWASCNADARLTAFSMKAGNLVSDRYTPEYTGYEPDLYALSEESIAGLSRQDLETKLFQPIDTDAAVALSKIECGDELTIDERHSWTIFLSSLRVRQPDVLAFLRSGAVDLFRRALAKIDGENPPAGSVSTEEWIEQRLPGFVANFGLSRLASMIEHADVLSSFGTLNWWTFRFTQTDPQLLLADMPLYVDCSLANPHLFVTLPIAPDLAFIGTRSLATEAALRALPRADLANQLNRASIASMVRRVWSATETAAREFVTANIAIMGVDVTDFSSLSPTLES